MEPWIWAALIVVVVALLLREGFIHVILPGVAQAAQTTGRKHAAKGLLLRSIQAWTLFSDRSRDDERYRLAHFFMEDGLHDEAIALLRRALSHRHAPGVEANHRRRLADVLESAGRIEEASEERRRAEAILEHAPQDVETLLAAARMRDQDNRYAEACDLYAQALPKIPRWNETARNDTLLKLALALFNADRMEDAYLRAEEVLASKPGLGVQMLAHSFAGLGRSGMGHYDEAEAHRRAAHDLALAAGNTDQAAEFLVQIASSRSDRGYLVEAIQACEKAAGMSLAVRPLAWLTQSKCLSLWGRFDEARGLLLRALDGPSHSTPSLARRSIAVQHLALADLEAETGDGEASWRHLEEAAAVLGDDPKIGHWCEAQRAWTLAVMGRATESEESARRAEVALEGLSDDASSRNYVLSHLALAATVRGDYARALPLWERWLALPPEPALQPMGWYFTGECHRRLGDPSSAREAYVRAEAVGLDTHYARQAHGRLREMGPAT